MTRPEPGGEGTMPADPDAVAHCVSKVVELAGRAEPDPRSTFQLGYNLGRLSELTGLGRGSFWDRWKDAVSAWDRPALEELSRRLQAEAASWGR